MQLTETISNLFALYTLLKSRCTAENVEYSDVGLLQVAAILMITSFLTED